MARQLKAARKETGTREKQVRQREELETFADMRESVQRRRLTTASEADEVTGSCFRQIGVLCLNDLDLTDVKARNCIYRSVQAKEVTVLTINLAVYCEIMGAWMRSQGSSPAQIKEHKRNAMKQIVNWLNKPVKTQARQDLQDVIEAEERDMAIIKHVNGQKEKGRSVLGENGSTLKEIKTIVVHNFLGRRSMAQTWKKKPVTVSTSGAMIAQRD